MSRAKRRHSAAMCKPGNRDANHAEIATALSRLGPEPIDTSKVGGGFPDLCWPFQGLTVLIEVKTPEGTLSPAQARFHAEWRGGPLFFVRNAGEIPAIIEAIQQQTAVRRRVIG